MVQITKEEMIEILKKEFGAEAIGCIEAGELDHFHLRLQHSPAIFCSSKNLAICFIGFVHGMAYKRKESDK